MDQLREAVGDEQLNYLGYSYGTTLGSTYAELYPDKVRAMVLDAAVDPDTDRAGPTPRRARPRFEAGFDAFAANCTGLIAGCPLGADPRRLRRGAASAQAEQDPIPSSEPTATPTPRRAETPRSPRHPRSPGRPPRAWS